MLERTNRKSYFEELLYEEFVCITKEDLSTANHRTTRSSYAPAKAAKSSLNDNIRCSPDERNMTRKTRTRRPRIQAIQSGYCAICSVPYNNVEEHIQSKKHQKLIGEDANYIALNGYVHPDVGIESLLSLTGIDAIGFDHDFSPKITRRHNMPRTRASSVVSDLVKSSPLSPTGSDYNGHHLRSRRNINYMTPPLEEDSLDDKPDFEPAKLEYKEYRELRSSTRALAKLTSTNSHETEPEVWESGRPKRHCISRRKRSSVDEPLASANQTYYKVEVVSNKNRSNDHTKEKDKDVGKRLRSHRLNSDHEKEKGLIVKFKKLRNTELVQLNNEATNFLFPKKEETSEEEDEGDLDTDCANTTVSSGGKNESTVSLTSDGEDSKTLGKFKVEDEGSMDSTSSETKRKRKRRTQAEAFIMDNQKYYKFETPGSRLRYQGSYLSPVCLKSPKSNEECSFKKEKEETEGKPKPRKSVTNINIDDYQFSFEAVPKNQSWYDAFLRQDKGEQHYNVTSNYYWDEFLMPYQMRHLKPLNPKTCMSAYQEIITSIAGHTLTEENLPTECTNHNHNSKETESETKSETIEICDEDSRASTESSSTSTAEELEMVVERRRPMRGRLASCASATSGKNPRKSPRQHASTLAILSSLIQQRKRRSRNTENIEEVNEVLPDIPEEPPEPVEEKPQEQPQPKPRTPKKVKKKIDYMSIASKIEEELDTALDATAEELDLELDLDDEEEPLCFNESQVRVSDILTLYENAKTKETELSCRRFFNGTPGRKPGKRTKNKTGWPTKVKRRKQVKDKNSCEENDSSIEGDSSEDDSDENDSNKAEVVPKPEVKKPVVRQKRVIKRNWPLVAKTRVVKKKAQTRKDSESETDEDVRTPTKKPLKRKKNKTGWPNVVRKRTVTKQKPPRRVQKSDKVDDNSDEESNSIKVRNCDENNRVRDAIGSKVLGNMQPYVYVKKLDARTDRLDNVNVSGRKVKKASGRRRRIMPGSPKSPRMLRKPRGRWYRER